MNSSPHSFHIPVMGTGFTMDTPLKVARYGIDSVVSMGDDLLMERLRAHYCEKEGLPYEAIKGGDGGEMRSRRVTAWLDFLDGQVESQFRALKDSDFSLGSDINRYFELLPGSPLRRRWAAMLLMEPGIGRSGEERALREAAKAGSIDVNIMTKVDRWIDRKGNAMPPDATDALSGLTGFGRSRLSSTVVFSAGMNPRLYGHLVNFVDFFPDAEGVLKKKVALKVSDYRSAEIQGRFLAKKGIWVSEFRLESGLNCGGHAFATGGQLMGPILEEFNSQWKAMQEELSVIWKKAMEKRGCPAVQAPVSKLTVQGGVGTAQEHDLLQQRYGAASVGWGTPFLLVPEATVVDEEHRAKLCEAGEKDVELSDASPLGIPFWSLRTSSSEDLRRQRIAEGRPGSPCPHAYLTFNTEFGPKPLCSSSRSYQKLKLEELDKSTLQGEALELSKQIVTSHGCICIDLSGGLRVGLGLEAKAPEAICPGPNLAWFDRTMSLEEMVGHIYGRLSVFSLSKGAIRPHMFLSELRINLDYMARELKRSMLGVAPKNAAYFEEYKQNLLAGMDYYSSRAKEIFGAAEDMALDWIQSARERVEGYALAPA
jgi:hypothetical protein